MKKLLIVVIVVGLIFVLIETMKNDNTDLSGNTQNSLSNSSNIDANVKPENTDKEKNNILEDNKENNTTEDNNTETENNIENEEPKNEVTSNEIDNNEVNKVPDNSYVGEEENSKDDYDNELDGENKAIVLVKEFLGDKASNYTYNVETTTSSAYVVRAMDENSSNTYFSVNFTTWVVSEI